MKTLDFANKVIKVYGDKLSKSDIRKFKIGCKDGYFLWNIFGYKLFENLEGDSARKEFDLVNKEGASEIHLYWNNGNETLEPLRSKHDSAMKIDEERITEFYVVGKNFEWIYIVTHEFDAAGPYFASIKNK